MSFVSNYKKNKMLFYVMKIKVYIEQIKYFEFTKVKKRRHIKRRKYKGSFEFISEVSLTLELIFLTLFYLMLYRKIETGKSRY